MRRSLRLSLSAAVTVGIVLTPLSLAASATATTATVPSATVSTTATQTPEQQIGTLINEQRARAGLPPLTVYVSLSSASEVWAAHLARNGLFEHSSSGWRSDRLGPAGWAATGENIAAGYTTARGAMDGWMASPGHKANILNSSYRGVGIGYVSGGPYGHYWVTIFGIAKPDIPKGTQPSIAGTVQAGTTLKASSSKWPAGTTLQWQWYRGNELIRGAKSITYKATAADVGKNLKVKVKGVNQSYFPAVQVRVSVKVKSG